MIWGVSVLARLVMSRSEIDHVANQAVEALLQRLRHRWVGVDVASQLAGGQVPPLRQRELRQQLGHVVADQVPTQ